MVNQNYSVNNYINEIRHVSIPILEIASINGRRFEAGVYCTDGRQARIKMNELTVKLEKLNKEGSFISDCYYPGRFKRAYVNKNVKKAFGFLGSAEMLDINPHPIKFLLPDKNDFEILSVKYGDVLVSRSGTIGNTTFVNKTLTNYLISEHAIRIRCKSFPGYLYTYLKTKTGLSLMLSNIYGAVVSQIEPEHLFQMPIPNPDEAIKEKINNLIIKSFQLRDESNDLVNAAQTKLILELQLPPLEKIVERQQDVVSFSVPAEKLQNRFDGSFHLPLVSAIDSHIRKHAQSVINLGDKEITKRILLPGRFKRVYVEAKNGTPFFGGKQLYELVPTNLKYLSRKHHAKRIDEQLVLNENTVLVTCSGTIGKVAIVPKHWEGWAANQHILRVIPSKIDFAGYVYAWLDTDYGRSLIRKYTYGAVVDEIDDKQIASVPVPMIAQSIQKEINDSILEANAKRYEAFLLEKEAISLLNTQVLNLS